MSTHLAAVTNCKGARFEVESRPTPKPGPGELLIAVKSIALNPADAHVRDAGIFITTYPTIIGFDIAGLVLEVGDDVPSVQTPQNVLGPVFQAGVTRVAAYAAFVWNSDNPDYGAFQEYCIVPWQHALPLPEQGISWNEAATLPVSLEVPLNALDLMGITRPGTDVNEHPKKPKTEALLIWGASSSVGTMGVQIARMLCDDSNSPFAAIYATAGISNHEYVSSLGANRVFDYKDPGVVDAIVSAAKGDDLVIRHCFLATGNLALCQAVLKAFVLEDQTDKAKITSAPIVPEDAAQERGVEVIFVLPSMDNVDTRLTQFRDWLGVWARQNLADGKIKPSPKPTIIGKGLKAINAGLDKIFEVSCTKLVVEIAE